MKNLIRTALCLLLTLVMVASVVACGDEAKETEAEKPETGNTLPETEPETEPQTEPETKHKHDYTFKSEVTPATCTEDGFTTQYCECGQMKKTDKTAALGHDWGEGVVTKPATETEEGERVYTCSRCGEKKTEVINKAGVVRPLVTFDETHNTARTDIQDYLKSVLGCWISNADHNGLNQDADKYYNPDVKRFRAFVEEGQLRFHGTGNTTITKTFNPTNNVNYSRGPGGVETFSENDEWYSKIFGANAIPKFTVEFDVGIWEEFPVHPDTRTDEQKAADALDPTIEPYDEFGYAKSLIDFQTSFYYKEGTKRTSDEGNHVNLIGYDQPSNSWTLLGNVLGCDVKVKTDYKVRFTFDTVAKTITATLNDGKNTYEGGTATYRDPVEGEFTAILFSSSYWYIDNYQVLEG